MRSTQKGITGDQENFDLIILAGGWDLATPLISIKPGKVRRAQNWEVDVNQGYTRIPGYERFDGQTRPSTASYSIIDITITGSLVAGNVVAGATSGATATVIAISSAGDDFYAVLTKITGVFQSGEDLDVSSVKQAEVNSTLRPSGATTSLLNAQYKNLAADEYRSDIAAVPGSGSVLGIIMYNDVKYAFRANTGGTAVDMYKSTAGGWSQVALGYERAFTSGGTTEITEGQTIVGAASGATAVVTRVMLESGSWAAGDAAGKFIFASQTGTFQAENIDVSGGGSNLATIAGDSSEISMVPGGRFEFDIANFGGQEGTRRLYGCDGVNRGFEFDGSVFCPIDTGMAIDAPSHVSAFKNHLFFSFESSSQHSGIGAPYAFTIISGAGEIAVANTITAYSEQPGSTGQATLGIFSQNRIHMLYGTSAADWVLVQYRREIGAYAYSVQEFGMTLMLDDRGIANLLTAQEFGNFQHNMLSKDIQPWIQQKRGFFTASTIARDKSQYRLFFSDKYALYLTTDNRKVLGIMPMLFKHEVTCITSQENSSGQEEIYFGSSDGYVFQLDRGTSFDGESIESFIDLPYLHNGSPRIKKRYKTASVEAFGGGYHLISFSYLLGYGNSGSGVESTQQLPVNFRDNQWDGGLVWDAFFWDGEVLSPSRAKLKGRAENISLRFRSNGDYFSPITLSSVHLRLGSGRPLR